MTPTSAIEKLGLDKLTAISKRYYELLEYVSKTPVEQIDIPFEYVTNDDGEITRYWWDECGATFSIITTRLSDDEAIVTELSPNILIDVEGDSTDDIDISDLDETINLLKFIEFRTTMPISDCIKSHTESVNEVKEPYEEQLDKVLSDPLFNVQTIRIGDVCINRWDEFEDNKYWITRSNEIVAEGNDLFEVLKEVFG